MAKEMSTRVFVPLTTRAYEWFMSGSKEYELRRARRQFRPENLRRGRDVELRRGYSGASIWGSVGDVVVADDLGSIFASIEYTRVVPDASSMEDAIQTAIQFVGENGPYVAFEVQQNRSQQ